MSLKEEDDSEQSSAPKLALFSVPTEKFTGMGMVTPPHHSASIPFRWEEEPGKPRPCKALSLIPETPLKGLELPPRLQYESKFTKTPSPTTVLEGPYISKSIFHSLRLIRYKEGSSSFDGGESGGSSPDRGLLSSVGISRRWFLQRKKNVDEGSFVFSTYTGENGDSKVEVTRITRKRSLLGLTKARSNFWTTIYGAVKQVIPSPRRSKLKN